MYDVIIIGSGPAGLSASVYAKRAMMNVIVIEKESYSGGQIVNTEKVDNYLGLNGISGYEMAMKFKEHATAMEVPFKQGNVKAITDDGEHKTVVLQTGEKLETKVILIATGANYKKLHVTGEEEFLGTGVSYCATCDGAFFRNRDVVVVGGGNVAFEDALYLSNVCRKVYLVHRRDTYRATKTLQKRVKEKDNIEMIPFSEIKKIEGTDVVESVVLFQNQTQEESTIEVSGVFVAVGMRPNTDFAKDVVEMNEAGYIVADESGMTNTKGVFVAGDVRTKALRQVSTAVSDGANTIASIEKFLEDAL